MRAKRHRTVVAAPTDKRDDFSKDVAGAWTALSPFKSEVGIAIERWRIMVTLRGLDPVMCFYAVATFAAQGRDRWHPHAPYHAIAFTEVVARTYIARIHEILHEQEKHDREPYRERRESGLRPLRTGLNDVMRELNAGHRTP